jgi:RNA polymerase sigma factor (TIGR02999 family)
LILQVNMKIRDNIVMTSSSTAKPRLSPVSTSEYQTLLRLARALHRQCPSWTLNPTALAHEALIKIHAWPNLPSSDDPHFLALAARAMRQLLVDGVRRKLYAKHGGGLRFVPLTERAGKTALSPVEFLDLNRALDELADLNPRHALAVEYTVFFGHTVEEAAAILKVAPKTIQRDLRAANAWLASRVRNGGEK